MEMNIDEHDEGTSGHDGQRMQKLEGRSLGNGEGFVLITIPQKLLFPLSLLK